MGETPGECDLCGKVASDCEVTEGVTFCKACGEHFEEFVAKFHAVWERANA